MNIYAIAVYPINANPIIATIHSNPLKADPYKEILETSIKPLADMLYEQTLKDAEEKPDKEAFLKAEYERLRKLKIADGYFYGKFMQDAKIIILVDDVIPATKIKQLFDNLTNAQRSKSTLRNILRKPDQATKTKIELLQEELDDVVDIMKDNIDKMILRGGKLEDLKEKSEEMLNTAIDFKKKGKKLREDACWNSLWPVRLYYWMWPAKPETAKKEPQTRRGPSLS